MNKIKAILLVAIMSSSANVIAKAIDYDKYHDQFMGITTKAIDNVPTPFKWYEGATVTRIDVQGTNLIWYVTVKDSSYFPGGENGPTTEVMDESVKTLLQKGYCNKPFSNSLPVSWIFRMENGANPVSYHPTYIANTAKDC